MATVRDQVEAYNFASRRQVLALLQGDDAVSLDPRRRLNRSLIGGVLLGVVALAAVGVAGFLSGGSATSVPSSGVIIDSDTGGAYVKIGDVLHPALNITSAKLIAGNQVTTVSGGALTGLPRGLPVGIPGAPDALPPSGSLTTRAWSVCTVAPEASAARAQVVVSIGAPLTDQLPGSAGLLARTPDGAAWLLDNGQRYHVAAAVAAVLGLNQVPPLEIDPAVLDTVPEGPPLVVPDVPGRGAAPKVSLPFHATVGDVVTVDNGTNQPGRYVVMQDGVAPVDPFAFQLLAAGAEQSHTVGAGDIAQAPAAASPSIPQLWPRTALTSPAAPPAAGEPFCVGYDPHAPHTAAAWPVSFSEPPRVPLAAHAAPVVASGTPTTAASAVAVPSGGGALVKAVSSGGVDAVYTLVTDSGLRFGIANADAVGRLGYQAAAAVPVPLPFVELLPAGPGLDPNAAATEYAGGRQAPPASGTPVPTSAPS